MKSQKTKEKTVSLSYHLTEQILILSILTILCTIVISAFLGMGVAKGQTTLPRFLVFMVIYLVILCAIVIFCARIIAKQIAKPMQEANFHLETLSNGNLERFSMEQNRVTEINALEKATQETVGYLNKYISNIDETLDRISKSDLAFEITEDYVGDFVTIKTSMNKIITSLNGTMKNIGTVSGQVLTISEQVSSSSQALAQGATEQASAVEELLSTINGISSRVSESAERAVYANGKADEVRTQITQSNQQMNNLISAMGEISSTSNQVAKIVKIIEDIAFQTNILALNAAVEAARAGVNGRSFAVVADEVKNLATKSASAAEDTTNLIKNTIAAVENGMNISTETADLLAGVVRSVDEVADIVNNISTASAEESASINQVVQGLDQVSTVVQSNSATAEESAAVSGELANFAHKLQEMVHTFQLKA